MDQPVNSRVISKLETWYRRAVDLFARLPLTGRLVLGLVGVFAILVAVHMAMTPKDSTLRLKVQHSFRSGQLWVWVDDDLAYSGKLTGAAKKRFGLIPDSVQGNLSETLQVPSGSHQVKVRASAEDGTVQEDTISGDFSRKSQRTLSASVRHSDISLSWQGGAAPVPETETAGASWFSRYASSLFLTAAGSIISALTGFALKEIPNQIRSRQSASPKA